jgi:hypothetical protein
MIRFLVRFERPPRQEGLMVTLNDAHVTAHANFVASLKDEWIQTRSGALAPWLRVNMCLLHLRD